MSCCRRWWNNCWKYQRSYSKTESCSRLKQIAHFAEAKRADLAEAEKSLASLMASQAVSKISYTQVASDLEASGRAFADEWKALAEATQVLQSETGGADGQTYSLFQKSSSAALQTSTDLKGFEMVTTVRRLAEQERSTALAQLASRISAIMKFGAGAGDDPFVKGLITDLINRLQAEASFETNQQSYCDGGMSKASEKKEDLEADVAKHSSKLEAAVARSIVLDGDISTLQSELGVLSNRQLHMYIMCAVERYILAKVIPFVEKIVEMLVNQMCVKAPHRPRTHMFKTSSTQPRWKLLGSSRRQGYRAHQESADFVHEEG